MRWVISVTSLISITVLSHYPVNVYSSSKVISITLFSVYVFLGRVAWSNAIVPIPQKQLRLVLVTKGYTPTSIGCWSSCWRLTNLWLGPRTHFPLIQHSTYRNSYKQPRILAILHLTYAACTTMLSQNSQSSIRSRTFYTIGSISLTTQKHNLGQRWSTYFTPLWVLAR